jgi:hypothetical protein
MAKYMKSKAPGKAERNFRKILIMKNKERGWWESYNVKWWSYIVILGLMPIMLRLIIATIVTRDYSIDWFTASDLVAFSLVLNISSMNGMNDFSWRSEVNKTLLYITSLVFIIVCTLLYAVILVAEGSPYSFKTFAINTYSIISLVGSISIGFAVYRKILILKAGS